MSSCKIWDCQWIITEHRVLVEVVPRLLVNTSQIHHILLLETNIKNRTLNVLRQCPLVMVKLDCTKVKM
jgi:hypothetical protein